MGFSTPFSRISWILILSESDSFTLPALPELEPPQSAPARSL